MSEVKVTVYIKVQHGTVMEVRSDHAPANLDIEICDLDVNEEEVLKATIKKWDLETNQLYKIYSFKKNEKI